MRIQMNTARQLAVSSGLAMKMENVPDVLLAATIVGKMIVETLSATMMNASLTMFRLMPTVVSPVMLIVPIAATAQAAMSLAATTVMKAMCLLILVAAPQQEYASLARAIASSALGMRIWHSLCAIPDNAMMNLLRLVTCHVTGVHLTAWSVITTLKAAPQFAK